MAKNQRMIITEKICQPINIQKYPFFLVITKMKMHIETIKFEVILIFD